MDYRFTSWEPRYRPRIVELFGRTFGGDAATNDAYLRWKYEENPYLAEPLFAIALQGDEVVGIRGFYGARWTSGAGDESVLIPAGADTAVAPEHRGRWLFEGMRSALEELRDRGCEYAFNFSGNRSVRVLSQRLGWQPLVEYQAWQRWADRRPIERATRRIRRHLRWRPDLVSPEFARLDQLALREAAPGCGDVDIAREPRSGEMADLVAATRDGRLGHVRDEAFYDWRFRDPRMAYRFLFIGDASHLDAFLVLEQQRTGGWVNIIDWAARDPRLLEPLICVALETGGNVQGWSATVPSSVLERWRALGVTPGGAAHPGAPPTDQGVLIASTAGTPPERWAIEGVPLLDASRWDLRMAYSDGY